MSNTAYALNVLQTLDQEGTTRVSLYAGETLKLATDLLTMSVKYLAVDAYYFKDKFVSVVIKTSLHIVAKLRNDADLLWLYTGIYSGCGCPELYDGKVHLQKDLSRFESIGKLKACLGLAWACLEERY